MNLRFGMMRITNFKSFLGQHEIDLGQIGLHFVSGQNLCEPRLGSNGSGKSTLFVDALSWCLYGRTISGLHNPDVFPWEFIGTTTVSLQLFTDDIEHAVKRSIKPNWLILDDAACDQENLERKLGLPPYAVFPHAIVLGQGQPLFLDLEPRHKLALFTSTLDLYRWDARAERASEKSAGIRQEIAQLSGKNLQIKSQHDNVVSQAAILKRQADEFQQERSKKIDQLKQEMKTKSERLAELQNLCDKADLAYDGAETERRACEREAMQLREYLAIVNTEKANHMAELNARRRELSKLKNELLTLGKADKCPTCGQSIKGTSLDRHKHELKQEISHLTNIISAGLSKAISGKIADLEQQLVNAENHQLEFRTKSDDAKSALDRFRPEFTALSATLTAMKYQCQELEDDTNPYYEQWQAATWQISQLATDLHNTESEITKTSSYCERVAFWAKGFRDLKLFVLEEILQDLQLASNVMLEEFGMTGWHMTYNIERETKSGTTVRGITTTITSPSIDSPVRWESWSGGEAQRLRLIGALTLSDVLLAHAGVSTSILVLDEPSRSLSVEGLDDLIEFLAQRAKQRQQAIFYIDHRVVESSHFTSTISVVKDERESRIII